MEQQGNCSEYFPTHYSDARRKSIECARLSTTHFVGELLKGRTEHAHVVSDVVTEWADAFAIMSDALAVKCDALSVNSDALSVDCDALSVDSDTFPVNSDALA